jgi:exonuclease VII small subunit
MQARKKTADRRMSAVSILLRCLYFRSLPSVRRRCRSTVSLAELDAQWQAIVKQLNAGSVPCDSLREYVVGCRSQKLASAHLKRAHVYVDSLLRMEQDAAVRTSAQMKEVIADLAG